MKRKNVSLDPDWGMDVGVSPEFELQKVKIGDGTIVIWGTVRGSIKIGDKFSHISKIEEAPELEGANAETLGTISLSVNSIIAYHTNLNRVNSGMEAQIIFHGNENKMRQLLQKPPAESTKKDVWLVPAISNIRLILKI